MSDGEQLDLSREVADDIRNRVRQLLEKWDHKLSIPLSELIERYLRADIGLVLDCSLGFGDIIRRKRFSVSISHDLTEMFGTKTWKGQIGASCDDHQLSVFIESVHVVNDAQRMVSGTGPSLVGLRFFDQGENPKIGDALYLSVVSGLFLFRERFAVDRELKNVFVIPPRGGAGKVPYDMVKAGSQVVNDFACKYAKSWRDFEVSMIVNRFLPALIVWIGENWIQAFIKEGDDFAVKIDDVLVGPF